MTQSLSPADVRELLEYDPDSGVLTWRPRGRAWFKDERSWKIWNTKNAGNEAFTATTANGYRVGAVLGKNYLAHRVAWAHVYGAWPEEVDHIDRDKQNNRIANLRDVTRSENNLNTARSQSPDVGIYPQPCGTFAVRLGDRYGGTFHNLEVARAERDKLRATRLNH